MHRHFMLQFIVDDSILFNVDAYVTSSHGCEIEFIE